MSFASSFLHQTPLFYSCYFATSYPAFLDSSHLTKVLQSLLAKKFTRQKMCYPCTPKTCLPAPRTGNADTEKKRLPDTGPPPYAERQPQSSAELPCAGVLTLKRYLISRMAFDWGLERHVPESERLSDGERRRFETLCENYGKVLSSRFKPETASQEIRKRALEVLGWVLRPGIRLGVPPDSLELFMFTVRHIKAKSGFLHRSRRMLDRRSELQLLRLVLDSRILIDRVADPHSAFAVELKAECALLHMANFQWLLDPTLINTYRVMEWGSVSSMVDPDIDTGHWKHAQLLIDECQRPCAALMDPALPTRYEVHPRYFHKGTKLCQQPGFTILAESSHRNLLPKKVTLGRLTWDNPDRHHNLRAKPPGIL
ncbi:hypothetical protein E4T47_02161 [Aureobasidium subglaciale]|nr:hypothetical protein E4T47_02161 [Aureobasidium subglaciale]